ncbi:hypothetical protein EON65_29105 [archaeon]|nr:MAG: hypothetical protein EON65_29105 [archaeon]
MKRFDESALYYFSAFQSAQFADCKFLKDQNLLLVDSTFNNFSYLKALKRNLQDELTSTAAPSQV